MAIELHTWNTPNGRKISVALEEMGLPYTVHPVNIGKGEQFNPDFLKISPNNRIPAIVDPEGPGGQPISVFESGAILIYLGVKTGQVLSVRPARPGAGAGVADVADGRVRPDARPGAPLPAGGERAGPAVWAGALQKETRRLYGVLDKRLAGRDYVADACSIADFAILGWAWRHERHQVDLADFPNVQRWYATMMARPGDQARVRGGAELTRRQQGPFDAGAGNPVEQSAQTPCPGSVPGVCRSRRRGGRVAEGGGLLNRYRGSTSIVSSNLIPSAKIVLQYAEMTNVSGIGFCPQRSRSRPLRRQPCSQQDA